MRSRKVDMPITSRGCWTRLSLLCCLAAGCASGRNIAANTAEPGGIRSLFTPKVSQASYEEEIEEVPAKPKDEYLLRLKFAELMEGTGNTDRAEQQYREIAKARPKNVAAILGIARMDILAGRYTAAEEGLARAERLTKNSSDVAATYGTLYVAQKDWDKAIEAYNKAVQNEPDDHDYRYQLALTLARAGRLEASLPHFSATVGDAAGHYNIALILRENGDLPGAEKHLQMALRKQPNLKEARQWLAEVRREQGLPTGTPAPAAANTVMTAAAEEGASHHTSVTSAAVAAPAAMPPSYLRQAAPGGHSPLTAQQREQLNNQL